MTSVDPLNDHKFVDEQPVSNPLEFSPETLVEPPNPLDVASPLDESIFLDPPVKSSKAEDDGETTEYTTDIDVKTPRTARTEVTASRGVVSTKRRRASLDTAVGVTVADLGVTVGGSVAYLAVGRKLRGYLAAFRAIRPLVVQILMLPPIKAYRSFKMLSRLQRMTHMPYPPVPPMYGLEPMQDTKLIEDIKRYLKFAAGAYGGSVLTKKNIQVKQDTANDRKGNGLGGSDGNGGLESYILCEYPKAELIYKREKPLFERPAFMLFSLSYKNEMILTIQGSTTTQDWVTNLVCNPCSENGNHSGMRHSAINLDIEIRQVLLDYFKTRKNWKCTIVGHSLGGGTATLLAIRWIKLLPSQYKSQIQAYSFGSPCIASQSEAQLYRNQIFSIIFGRDLIARLSFGTVRDLLAQLHGLCCMSKRKGDMTLADIHQQQQQQQQQPNMTTQQVVTKNQDPLTASTRHDSPIIIDENSSSPLPIDTPMTPPDEDDDDDCSIGSDEEVELLEHDDLIPVLGEGEWTLKSTELDVKDLKDGSYDPKMGGHNRREQIRRDLTFAQENMTLPIPYKELRRLVRKRARELDEKIKELRVMKKRRRFSFHCGGTSSSVPEYNSLTDSQKDSEFNMMKDSMKRIYACSVSSESEQMMPAGSAILIIPKLHFVVAQVQKSLPKNNHDGQCYLFRCEGINLVKYLQQAIWHTEAMKDHDVSCYYQGLCPEDLVSMPLHSSLLPTKEAKIAGIENAAEVLATPMNRQTNQTFDP